MSMKHNKKPTNQELSLADLDCKLCLYYGGRSPKKPSCLLEKCCCEEEINQAKRREKY